MPSVCFNSCAKLYTNTSPLSVPTAIIPLTSTIDGRNRLASAESCRSGWKVNAGSAGRVGSDDTESCENWLGVREWYGRRDCCVEVDDTVR